MGLGLDLNGGEATLTLAILTGRNGNEGEGEWDDGGGADARDWLLDGLIKFHWKITVRSILVVSPALLW